MLDSTLRQRGVSLVELMIASAIGLIAIAAILTVYAATVRHSSEQLEAAHLHHQLFGLLHLISTDIRRAGYWQFDTSTQTASDNPFMAGENRMRSQAYPDESDNSCILFAYDLDKDGRVGIGKCNSKSCPESTDVDNVEQFGFRLRNLSVQSRYGGNATSCDSGYWQTLNDTDIEVTRLRFDILENCTDLLTTDSPCSDDNPQLILRAVFVDLAGQLVNQPETAVQLNRWIIVRNDVLVDAPE
jgi:prepilin-type N-terminal cleavage/methylation domain-containing protein